MSRSGELSPVAATERIASVDVLRGFSLLGILAVNIHFFSVPSCVFFDPRAAGGFTGIHRLTWELSSIFFLQKMMGIFSMLFGAGLILMDRRVRAAGKPLCGVYYRRVLWLILFGMIHGYFIWYGDILFTYGLLGLFLYLFRNRSPKLLIALGLVVLLSGSLVQCGVGFGFQQLRRVATELSAAERRGQNLSGFDRDLIALWEEYRPTFEPTPEAIAEAEAAYRGGYLDNLASRVPETFFLQTEGFLFYDLWHAGGMMLLGMALMKLGVFSGERSARFYIKAMVVGYVVGLPLCVARAEGLVAHDFDVIYRFTVSYHLNYWGSVFLVLAYVSTLVLIVRGGWLKGLTARLAAVGRLALSNYLLHSIICSTLFYGFGFGLFNRLERFWLFLIAVAIWIVQLSVSPWWLKRYRFGPAEWLWRSLTYWRLQPLRQVR